ncbi:MAG: hypothetical protein K0S80_3985, partial [Neobacillus sp.]|nr:hypothetical protein [Neobacillus sp.]
MEHWFTIIFTFLGTGIGGYTGYVIIQKYYKKPVDKSTEFKNDSQITLQEAQNYPIIDVTIDQVRKAVRQFSDNLPK